MTSLLFSKYVPRPIRRLILRYKVRKHRESYDRTVDFLRYMASGHASFCNCGGCNLQKRVEAGEFLAENLYDEVAAELGVDLTTL